MTLSKKAEKEDFLGQKCCFWRTFSEGKMQSRRKIVAASCRLCTRLLPILGSLVAYFEVLSSALWCCSHAGSVSFPAWERSQSRLLATPNPKSSDCKLTFAAFLARFRLKRASRKPISLVTISRLQRQENLFFCHFPLHLMVILKDNINAYFFVVSLDLINISPSSMKICSHSLRYLEILHYLCTDKAVSSFCFLKTL